MLPGLLILTAVCLFNLSKVSGCLEFSIDDRRSTSGTVPVENLDELSNKAHSKWGVLPRWMCVRESVFLCTHLWLGRARPQLSK